MKTLKKDCVILKVSPDKKGRDKLSPVVNAGFSPDLVGSTFPMLVICSPDQTVCYTQLSNKDLHSSRALRKAKETAVSMYRKHTSGFPKPDQKLNFEHKDGYQLKIYVGEILSETTFMGAYKKGNEMEQMNTDKYTDGAKNYIKLLFLKKGEKKKTKQEEEINKMIPKLVVENWKNKNGKTVKAKFVSLKHGEITLDIAGRSKPVTFSVNLLDKTSQKRAKEIAAIIEETTKMMEQLKAKADTE